MKMSASNWEMAARYDANKAVVGVAFFLWFSLGFLGAHRFYFRRFRSAVLLALVMSGGALLAWNNFALRLSDSRWEMKWTGPILHLPQPVIEYNTFWFPVGLSAFVVGCAWWALDGLAVTKLVRRHNLQLIENLKRDFGESNLTPPQNKENPNAQV